MIARLLRVRVTRVVRQHLTAAEEYEVPLLRVIVPGAAEAVAIADLRVELPAERPAHQADVGRIIIPRSPRERRLHVPVMLRDRKLLERIRRLQVLVEVEERERVRADPAPERLRQPHQHRVAVALRLPEQQVVARPPDRRAAVLHRRRALQPRIEVAAAEDALPVQAPVGPRHRHPAQVLVELHEHVERGH